MNFSCFRLNYLLFALGLLTSAGAWAQAPGPGWQNTHELPFPGNITATVNANGSVYVAGVMMHWSEGAPDPESGPSSTGNNAFVGKWNPVTHRLVWMMEMGTQPGDHDGASTLVVQDSSVYVLGSFDRESAGFGHPIKAVSNFGDVFVTRLTDHGTHATAEWTQPLGFSQSYTQAQYLACEGAILYVAGTTRSQPTNYDPVTGNPEPGITRAFVAKLTDTGTQGVAGWQRTWVVSRDYYELLALSVQRGKLYLAANTWQPTPMREEPTGTLEFGSLPRHANYRLHLTQLSDLGGGYRLDWNHTEAGQGANMAVTGNAIYVVGREDAERPLGPPAAARDVPGDLFVAKLIVAGPLVRPAWVQRLCGTGHDESARLHYVAVRGRHVYVAGTFGTPSLTIGPVVLANAKPRASGERDLFVAQLTDTGRASHFDWAQRLGSKYSDDVRAFSLADSRLYVSGFFPGLQGMSVLLGEQQYLFTDNQGGMLLQSWLPVSE